MPTLIYRLALWLLAGFVHTFPSPESLSQWPNIIDKTHQITDLQLPNDPEGFFRTDGRCEPDPYRQCIQCSFTECYIECELDERCISFTFKFRPNFEECRMNRVPCLNRVIEDPYNPGLWRTYDRDLSREPRPTFPNVPNIAGYSRIYGRCHIKPTANQQKQMINVLYCSPCQLTDCKRLCDQRRGICMSFAFNFITMGCYGVENVRCERALPLKQWGTYVKNY